MILPEAPAPPAPGDSDRGAGRAVDLAIRAGGWLVATVAAVVTGLLELFLTPLRVAGVPVGVAILMAAAANTAIAWFAVVTTGRRRAIAAPWIVWTLLMLFATGYRRPEGDYLVGGDDWVALVMVLVGSLAFAVYTYRTILNRRPSR